MVKEKRPVWERSLMGERFAEDEEAVGSIPTFPIDEKGALTLNEVLERMRIINERCGGQYECFFDNGKPVIQENIIIVNLPFKKENKKEKGK